MKKRISRSKSLLRIGRNFLPTRELSNRYKRLIMTSRRSGSFRGRSTEKNRSNFALQLQAKQKIAAYYGALSAHALWDLYGKTVQRGARQIQPAESVLACLESRLDVVVVRIQWATTLNQARQMISHGRIRVNMQPMSSSSYILQAGDIVHHLFAKQKVARQHVHPLSSAKRYPQKERCSNMSHIEVNYKTQTCIFLYNPQYIQWPFPFNLELAYLARYFQR